MLTWINAGCDVGLGLPKCQADRSFKARQGQCRSWSFSDLAARLNRVSSCPISRHTSVGACCPKRDWQAWVLRLTLWIVFSGTDLPDGQISRIRVQPSRHKNFACAVGQIRGTESGRPVPPRGAYARSPRTLGAGCDGRVGVARRAIPMRTAKSCGPDTPTLVSSLRVIPQATVAIKPGTPGRARYKP